MHSSFQALRRPELLLTQRSYSLFLFVDLNEQFRLAPPDTSWPLHDGKKLFQRTSTIVQIIRTKDYCPGLISLLDLICAILMDR